MVLEAGSTKEGEKLFSENHDADVIVVDGFEAGGVTNTLPLVRKIKSEPDFHGVIIGTSTNPDFRKLLVEAGCDCESPKELVHQKLIEILLAA